MQQILLTLMMQDFQFWMNASVSPHLMQNKKLMTKCPTQGTCFSFLYETVSQPLHRVQAKQLTNAFNSTFTQSLREPFKIIRKYHLKLTAIFSAKSMAFLTGMQGSLKHMKLSSLWLTTWFSVGLYLYIPELGYSRNAFAQKAGRLGRISKISSLSSSCVTIGRFCVNGSGTIYIL